MEASDDERSVVHRADYHIRLPEHFRRCSWCGSVHPIDLLLARDSSQITHIDRSVDRKYGYPHKVYVDIASVVPATPVVIGGRSEATQGPYSPGGPKYDPPGPNFVRETELTEEQKAIATQDGWLPKELSPTRYLQFGTRPIHHGKFYTIHTLEPWLDEQQRDQLFAMVGYHFEWVDSKQEQMRFRAYNYG